MSSVEFPWYGEAEEIRTLLLDYEKVLKFAEITGKPDHGFFIDGMCDYRMEEGIQHTFKIEAVASKKDETSLIFSSIYKLRPPQFELGGYTEAPRGV